MEYREEVSEGQSHGWRGIIRPTLWADYWEEYEKPKVMAREALGLDCGWSSGKRYDKPRVMVG